jgi:tellurite resistance protein TerC
MSTVQSYVVFVVAITVLLAIDLLFVHRRARVVSIREAAVWSVIWIVVGILFGFAVAVPHATAAGHADPSAYFGVFLLEKSLSVDNVFLFVLIFSTLAVPKRYQHRVLFYGVVGAIVMRAAAVHISATVIDRFSWILYVAGAFLVFAGVKLWRERHESEDLEDPKLFAAIKRVLPTTDGYRGERFFVRENKRLLATPLLAVLVFVEMTDFVLALDGLPAALSVTQDPFIIVTATTFALLGLRSLYFLLAAVADRLRHIKSGVAIILVFIGGSLILENVTGAFHPTAMQSMVVIVLILAGAVIASLRADGEQQPAP